MWESTRCYVGDVQAGYGDIRDYEEKKWQYT